MAREPYRVHILTDRFPPDRGRLERWTYDLAMALSAKDIAAVVYVGAGTSRTEASAERVPFEVVDVLAPQRIWAAPLEGGESYTEMARKEKQRLAFACLRAELARRVEGQGADIILSNFVTTVGLFGSMVAHELSLPHVAVLAGSDFTRGMLNATDRFLISEVCRTTAVVVGRSREQIEGLKPWLSGRRLEMIETSVMYPKLKWKWKSRAEPVIFSDCGFSFKKGTGVLLDSFVHLLSTGIRGRLVLCGTDHPGQELYWQQRRDQLLEKYRGSISFPGFLSAEEVSRYIYQSNMYASATLGEGCSAARARALCSGIPVLSTSCGELWNEPNSPRLRTVAVGDHLAFQEALSDMARDQAHPVPKSSAELNGYRYRFDPRREWDSWIRLLDSVFGGRRFIHEHS